MAESLKAKWADANRRILDGLDIQAEYAALGLRIPSSSRPRSTGWLPVHAMDRDDNDPSAEINIGEGPARGRYRDFGGTGQTLSLFDFAARFGAFAGDWREARKHYARTLNVSLPNGEEELSADKFEFFDLTPGVIAVWCGKKPGLQSSAVVEAGGVGARWPKKLAAELTHHLIVFPMYGPGLLDLEPTGWHGVNSNGGKIRKFKGKGVEPDQLKTITVGTPGLMNVTALRRIMAGDAKVVWLVEGITDLLAMQGQIPADSPHVVLSLGACSYHLSHELLVYFAGLDVRICFDCDKPGQTGALVNVGKLVPHAAAVRNVVLPFEIEESHGKDLRDYFASGKTYADLWDLSQACAPIDAEDPEAQVEPHQALLDSLGVLVSGQIEGTDQIEIFSTKLHKKTIVKDIDRFTYAKGVLALGRETMAEFVTEAVEPIPGKYQMRDVRNAIASEAAKRFLSSKSAVGVGIWPVQDSLVLVGARGADLWNGAKVLEQTSTPAVKGQRIDFGAEEWYEREQLGRLLQMAGGIDWRRRVLAEADELFGRWDNWKDKGTPRLLTGLVAASWIQTAWELRPLVGIIGPTNCGKSILVEETLPKMFGSLGFYSQKPTEAGIRQMIDNTAKVLIIDEFEEDYHRAKVLELLRTSSRGGQIIRGTASQRGAVFGLRHIVWVASIELGLRREADKNRFIVLELEKLPAGRPSQLRIPSVEELRLLGLRMLACAMTTWREAVALAADLKSRPLGVSVSNRVVELYAAPVAIYAMIAGWDDKQAETLLKGYLERRGGGQEVEESDEEQLLGAIYESVVILPRGGRVTISELLRGRLIEDGDATPVDRKRVLESVGISVTDDLEAVFFAKSPIVKELLGKSEFKNMDIDQILLRIAGAKRCRMRLGGHHPRGVTIPVGSIKSLIKADDSVDIFDAFK